MRPGAKYIPVDSDVPFQGLMTSEPSNKIPASFSPRLMNTLVRDGVVKRRPGGYQLGQRLCGRVMALTEAGEIGEDPVLLALTSLRQYYYDVGTAQFVDITDGQVDYDVTAYGDNYIEISGDHTAELPATRIIPLIDAGVNEGVYTVVSSSIVAGNTRVLLSETLSDNARVPVSDYITLANDLTTEDKDFLSYVLVTDLNGRRFLLTNGRDQPLVWSCDVFDDFVPWTPTYTDFYTCKSFRVFNEHLFMGNITTGSDEPQLIAWSKAGDFDDFETGDSGAQLLYQMSDGILAMKVLGDRLAIYSFNQIMTGVYIGLPAVFQFEVVIEDGVRLAGPNSIVGINVGHIYMSEESFYLFDGSRGLQVLGNDIYNDFKETKDHDVLINSACLNDTSKRTIFFSVPAIEGGVVTFTLFYNLYNFQIQNWSKEQYHDSVTCWGFFTNRGEAITWEDASYEPTNNPWDNELGAWAGEGEQLNFPVRAYGTSDGRVVIVNETASEDRGYEVEQSYETKDFEVPDLKQSSVGRWAELEFEASGSDVTVEYSIDRGHTFVEIGSQTLSSVITRYRMPFDVVSRMIRYRFTTTGNYTLAWVRSWVEPGVPE